MSLGGMAANRLAAPKTQARKAGSQRPNPLRQFTRSGSRDIIGRQVFAALAGVDLASFAAAGLSPLEEADEASFFAAAL